MHNIKLNLCNLDDTKSLAKILSSYIKKTDVILLKGDLGSGKTTFAQFLIKTLIPTENSVQSPTFNIVNNYENDACSIWHLDLYRLQHEDELVEIGIEEFLTNGITIIEWPELAENIVHQNKITISFTHESGTNLRTALLHLSGRFVHEEKGLSQKIENEFNTRNRTKE